MANLDKYREKLADFLKDYFGLNASNIRSQSPVAFSCLNPAHEDKHPSMYYCGEKYGAPFVKCFSSGKCETKYDIFDLVEMKFGITSFPEKLKKLKELYNDLPDLDSSSSSNTGKKEKKEETREERLKKVFEYVEKWHKDYDKVKDYVENIRKISPSVAKEHCLGYNEHYFNGKYLPVLTMKTDNGYIIRNLDPNCEKTDRYRRNSKAEGSDKFTNIKYIAEAFPCFITEGELDTFTLETVGFNSICVGGAKNTTEFVEYIKLDRPKCVLIPLLDNDEAGQEGKAKFIDSLKKYGLKYYEPKEALPNGKDPNESYCNNPEAFKEWCAKCFEAALKVQNELDEEEVSEEPEEKEDETPIMKELKKGNVGNNLQSFFDEIRMSKDNSAFATGIKSLDRITDGGLPEGLTIISAGTSMGKTSLVLQIADSLARRGNHILYFSLEMSKSELVSRSLSRLTAEECARNDMFKEMIKNQAVDQDFYKKLPLRSGDIRRHFADIRKNELQNEGLNRALEDYQTFANNITVINNSNVNFQVVKKYFDEAYSLYGKPSICVIDYLQKMDSFEGREKDKRLSIEDTVKALVNLGKENHVPVLCLSSINRAANGVVTEQSAKESGEAEYSADLLLGLTFPEVENLEEPITAKKVGHKIRDEKARNPRVIALNVLKNRDSEIPSIKECPVFAYYCAVNYFYELENKTTCSISYTGDGITVELERPLRELSDFHID